MEDKAKQLAIVYWQDKFAKFFPKSKGPTDLEIAMFVGGYEVAQKEEWAWLEELRALDDVEEVKD